MFRFLDRLFSSKEEISEKALEHSSKGEYTKSGRMKSGGHGQEAIDYMDKNGIKYNITKVYSNGVRLGNVPRHKVGYKSKGDGQCWFPKEWDRQTIKKAGQKVAKGEKLSDGQNKEGVHKKVVVVIKRTHGKIATIFPKQDQKLSKKKRGKE